MSERKNLLLGLTGSIAGSLYKVLLSELDQLYNVTIVITDNAQKICNIDLDNIAYTVYTDQDEWRTYRFTKEVLHINLRKSNDILLVAPATANTIAKFANGFADNLLTNVFCAWDFSKPAYIAPAMNAFMWENLATQRNISHLSKNCTIIEPIEKKLYCGDEGIGAMALIKDIIKCMNH